MEPDTNQPGMVNQAAQDALAEDLSDLFDIEPRRNEQPVSYESLLEALKSAGRI